MIGIKDMTSQEIKELASSRGKEIMEKIENSKGTEEGILQDWLRASAAQELESKVNAYMDKLEVNPELYDFLKDIQCSVILKDINARKEALKENTTNYTALEDKYNKLEKSYNDIEARNTQLANNERELKLEVEIISQGFKKENLKEVSALRNSLFKDEEDDAKAVTAIKEKYEATYFPKEEKPVDIPNETSFNSNTQPKVEPNITRKTSIKDLIKKKENDGYDEV